MTDPLRLPRETSLRFLLTFLAVIAATLALAESAWYVRYESHELTNQQRCLDEATAPDGTQDVAVYRACRRGSEHDRILWTLGWVPFVGVLTLTGAAGSSVLGRRRRVLVPLERVPALARLRDELAPSALPAPPPLRWRPDRPIATARAGGLIRPYVEVSPQLAVVASVRPSLAGAVLHHEAAHIRRRDLVPSALTLWSGPAVMIAAAVFAWMVRGLPFGTVSSALARVAVPLAVVASARSGALRSRELDADAHAAAWGQAQGLLAAFEGAAAPRKLSLPARASRIFAHHPSIEERRGVVQDARHVCRLGALEGVLVGLTAAIGAPVIGRLVRGWVQYGQPQLYADLLGWAFAGAVLGSWLALYLYRTVALSDEWNATTFGEAGVGLCAATAVAGVLYDVPVFQPLRGLPVSLTGWVTFAGLTVSLAVVALWILTVATLLGPRCLGRGGLLVALVTPAAAAAGLVLGVFGYVWHAVRQLETVRPPGLDPSDPLTLLRMFMDSRPRSTDVVLAGVMVVTTGGLAVTHGRRWPLRRIGCAVFRLLAGAVGAAGAGLGAYALYLWGWDPLQRLSEAGWYRNELGAKSSLLIVAGPVALVAAWSGKRHRVLEAGMTTLAATGFAAAGVPLLQATAGRRLRMDTIDDVWLHVTPVALFAALAAASVLTLAARSPFAFIRARVVGTVIGTTVAACLLAAGIAALDARPSAATERDHYRAFVVPQLGSFGAVTGACLGGAIDDDSVIAVESTRRAIGSTLSRPERTEFRRMHDELVAALDTCSVALGDARRAGRASLSETEFTPALGHFKAFSAGLTTLGLLPAEA